MLYFRFLPHQPEMRVKFNTCVNIWTEYQTKLAKSTFTKPFIFQNLMLYKGWQIQTFFCFRCLMMSNRTTKMIKIMTRMMIRIAITIIHCSSSSTEPSELEEVIGFGGFVPESIWWIPSLYTEDGSVVNAVPSITILRRLVCTMTFNFRNVWFLKNSFWYKMKSTWILPGLIVQFKNSSVDTFNSFWTSSQILVSNSSLLPTFSTKLVKLFLNLKYML